MKKGCIFAADFKSYKSSKLLTMDKDFKDKVKKAMDMMMHNSTSMFLAVAACTSDINEAAKMVEYIKSNL